MAYLIYKSDGTSVTVADNALDTDFYNSTGGGGFGPGNVPQTGKGLGTYLVGRNTIDYGAAIAQNFLQLTENFCSSTVPSDLTSLQGQLWFNQTSYTTGDLYVRVANANSGGIANWSRLLAVDSNGVVILGDLPVFGVNNGVVAAGTTQADATAISKAINIVINTPLNSGVRLPVALAGYRVIIRNGGANALKVYPGVGAAIESAGTNIPITLPVGASLEFYCSTSAISGSGGQWYNLGAIYS